MRMLNEKTVRARRNHRCDLCLMDLCAGDHCISQVIVDDGRAYTLRAHPECMEIVHLLDLSEPYADIYFPEGCLWEEVLGMEWLGDRPYGYDEAWGAMDEDARTRLRMVAERVKTIYAEEEE